jgi:hypothetical protein
VIADPATCRRRYAVLRWCSTQIGSDGVTWMDGDLRLAYRMHAVGLDTANNTLPVYDPARPKVLRDIRDKKSAPERVVILVNVADRFRGLD